MRRDLVFMLINKKRRQGFSLQCAKSQSRIIEKAILGVSLGLIALCVYVLSETTTLTALVSYTKSVVMLWQLTPDPVSFCG